MIRWQCTANYELSLIAYVIYFAFKLKPLKYYIKLKTII